LSISEVVQSLMSVCFENNKQRIIKAKRKREDKKNQFYIGFSNKLRVIQSPCISKVVHYNQQDYNCKRFRLLKYQVRDLYAQAPSKRL
jgi:hypothetical protein